MKFKRARINDKVYDLLYGEGTVLASTDDHPQFNIYFPALHITREYFLDGRLCSKSDAVLPTLYWVKPEIIEKPRKVMKTITQRRYYNIWFNKNDETYRIDQFHARWECQEQAGRKATSGFKLVRGDVEKEFTFDMEVEVSSDA